MVDRLWDFPATHALSQDEKKRREEQLGLLELSVKTAVHMLDGKAVLGCEGLSRDSPSSDGFAAELPEAHSIRLCAFEFDSIK